MSFMDDMSCVMCDVAIVVNYVASNRDGVVIVVRNVIDVSLPRCRTAFLAVSCTGIDIDLRSRFPAGSLPPPSAASSAAAAAAATAAPTLV